MTQSFRAAGHDWRLYCGTEVLERYLPEAAVRAKAQRAFVICSPSINRRTDTVERIRVALGERFAGVYDGIEKDSTYSSVQAATNAAREAGADMLIAAGGGSVIVAVRAIAIYLAEDASPFELMTQYPEGKTAYSPRLMAPKLPIVNVPTTPTNAMNRAGTGLKNPDLDHRMEYFDPKTRPHSIFLDEGVLLSSPPDVIRSTATTVFAGAISSISQMWVNPLVAGDLQHSFRLAHDAYLRLMEELDNPALRIDLSLAAFLTTRAEDDGRGRFTAGPFSGSYAISTALHVRYPRVGQGESTSVVHAPALRLAAAGVEEAQAQQVASAMGVWSNGMGAEAAAMAVADRLEEVYAAQGVPTQVRQLDIPEDDLIGIARETIKNFNANAGARSPDKQVADALKLLQAAW
ncbi:iron-containing alcohol dehydrogenase [Porticoccaceae bacterium]|nr:iron-containing alcohol dehydrogenase [Porticoccaceae bacterium]